MKISNPDELYIIRNMSIEDPDLKLEPHRKNYIDFEALLAEAESYDDFERTITDQLDKLRKDGKRVGFVSGKLVFADDKSTVKLMNETTQALRQQLDKDGDFIILSSLDIFKGKAWNAWANLKLGEDAKSKMDQLCSAIVMRSTDLFMLPNWRQGKGAISEYKTGLNQKGITIYNLAPPLNPIDEQKFNQEHGIES